MIKLSLSNLTSSFPPEAEDDVIFMRKLHRAEFLLNSIVGSG